MNIYFAGIGGVGIGPLAQMALDNGDLVSGSDPSKSPISDALLEKGVEIDTRQDGVFLSKKHGLQPFDYYVRSSAIKEDNTEMIVAKRLGIPIIKRDELINIFISSNNLKLIAIAGTHGKTTTTGMMIWLFHELDIPISYSIGTTISFGESGKLDKKSQYFVYECDEFDRNFLKFQPYLSVIASLDYDHPDTYPSITDYQSAFLDFVKNSQSTITWRDQSSDIFSGQKNVEILDDAIDFKLAGEHNRKNASLVLAAYKKLGIENNQIISILESFPGTDRRFEKLADNLYSDYGHHPVEIRATLELAHELSNRIMLIYQPHQNIRQTKLVNEYYDQFESAESIYWLPTYLSREDPKIPILKPDELVKNITNKDVIKFASLDESLWKIIKEARKNNILVLCMGAGSIDSWLRDNIAKDY